MSSGAPLSYELVSTTLRPPRVVIVIDGGSPWTYLARRALYRAGRIWGGAGFAIVPHHSGKVHPTLLRACQVYDPDYVLAYFPTIGDMEQFQPGQYQIRNSDGELLTGEKRQAMLNNILDQSVACPDDLKARDEIASVCSTYQTTRVVGWHDALGFLEADDSRHFTPATDVPGAWSGSVLASPEKWGGLLGTAIASHAGIAAPPTHDLNEPEVSDEDRAELASWVLDAHWATPPQSVVWHPAAAVGVDTRKTPTAHDRTMTHLLHLASGRKIRQSGLLVLGDSPDDFALARLWRLNFGTGYWLPSILIAATSPGRGSIGRGISRIRDELSEHGRNLTISSISMPRQGLEELYNRMAVEKMPMAAVIAGMLSGHYAAEAEITDVEQLPWDQRAALQIAVRDQWDTTATIPVSVDPTSTVSMAAPLPPPMLKDPGLATLPEATWHVDVRWNCGQGVRRRGIDSVELFVERPAARTTWVRSSRDGITYQASRSDVVLAGALQENRLARVALRDPSLDAWIQAKGTQHGYDVRPSDAGRRATLLATMLGGRQRYTELFGGPLLSALRAMLPTHAANDAAYPDRQGVVLSAGEGVLSFAGLSARCPQLTNEELRGQVDVACEAGVLRRGLVLRCSICEQKQFQPIDKLAQQWTCQRCDSPNSLTQWAWRAPHDEPTWFYDLHAAGRQVLRDNGHVPALLSAFLSGRSSRLLAHQAFSDAAEVVFAKDGQDVVELDLVAYADDKITIAECKTSGRDLENRAGRREVTKKCQAAVWLRADELLFATTADSWTSASQSAIRSAVGSFPHWGPLGPPAVALVSQLGTSEVKYGPLPKASAAHT